MDYLGGGALCVYTPETQVVDDNIISVAFDTLASRYPYDLRMDKRLVPYKKSLPIEVCEKLTDLIKGFGL